MDSRLFDKFKEIFGYSEGAKLFFAPGRVNLIGEHIDYNGGFVFPCALTIGTYAVVKKRDDKKLRLYSLNFENMGIVECDIDSLIYDKCDDWANYPKGVVKIIMDRGYNVLNGFDILFWGNIPNGAGLSSSASIEVLTGYIVSEIFDLGISNSDLAIIGMEAENTFNGMNCGIMDQFAIAMGKKNHAIFLDTNSLEYKYAPIVMDGYKLLVMNTNKQRKLEDSKYNERRSECEAALNILKQSVDVNAIAKLSVDQFNEVKDSIKEEKLLKRARHVVYENKRTLDAYEALNNKDLELFGELMYESHKSLKEDYEVSGIELDTLVETAMKVDGVLGARMTGAGFGGCSIALVRNDSIENVKELVGKTYVEKIGYAPEFIAVEVGDGPRLISTFSSEKDDNGKLDNTSFNSNQQIDDYIHELIMYGIKTDIIEAADIIYTRNRLLDVLNLDVYSDNYVNEENNMSVELAKSRRA